MTDRNGVSRWVAPLRRLWFVPLAALLLGLAATALTLPDTERSATDAEVADPDVTFRATHLLIRNGASPEPINFDLVELLAQQGDLTNRVVDAMDGEVSAGEVEAVTLETAPDIGTISVTTVQPDPDLAARLATVYAQQLQGVVDERATASLRDTLERIEERLPRLADDVEALEARVDELSEDDLERQLLESERESLLEQFGQDQTRARDLRDRLEATEAQFETLQEPSPVSTADDGLIGVPTAPLPRFVIFGFLSLLVGVLLVLGIGALDTRVRTRSDAEEAFGLPVIAELPPRSDKERDAEPLPVLSDPIGLTAEAFRTLRVAIRRAPVWRLGPATPSADGSVGTMAPVERTTEPRTLLVTSSLTGDGKSTTVANLAAAFAAAGQLVLVVDCDFRRPAVGKLLGVGPGPGLRDLTAPGYDELDQLAVPTDVPGVEMIRAGSPGIAPTWFLNDPTPFVRRVRELAEIVIFDTGPITLTNEASELVPTMDGVLLVNRAGRLTRSGARDTVEQLTRLRASMSGIVMVGTHGARRYGYYTPVTAEDEPSTPPRHVARPTTPPGDGEVPARAEQVDPR